MQNYEKIYFKNLLSGLRQFLETNKIPLKMIKIAFYFT